MANQTFEQYLASSGQQSTADQLRKSNQFGAAEAQYNQQGYYGSQPQQQSQPNFQDSIKQAIEMNKQAIQPAVQSLEASIPETSASFQRQREQTQGEIEPLKQRYQNLLSEVTGKAKASEEGQTRVTSGELAKRGIVGSSTLAQQEIQNAVEPIRSQARTAFTNIGLEQEQGIKQLMNTIANLTGQETEATRAVRNAIAQLQSGAGQAGVSQGISTSQFNAQQALQQAEQQRAAEQQRIENLRNEQLFPIQLKGAQADLDAKLKANKSSGLGGFVPFGMNSSGQQIPSPTTWTGGTFGKNVVDLLNQGKTSEAYELYKNA